RVEVDCRLLRIPDVEVGRQTGGLVEREELEPKARHALEARPSVVGKTDHASAVERALVLEADVDADHRSSSVPSEADAADNVINALGAVLFPRLTLPS